MDTTVCTLIERGVAPSTLTTYDSGKKRYISFCTEFHFTPLPVEESVLCRFVAFLSLVPLSHQSIRSYLSAVRHMQIMSGLPDPVFSSFPRLDYALKGVRRDALPRKRANRLPITPDLLRKISIAWRQQSPDWDRIMLWAAFCLGFFGFMRAGEFTCPSHEAFTPHMLSRADVSVDSHSTPTHLAVHLRQSKTDQFGAGVTLQLGTTGDPLCPVTAMLGYLAIRPTTEGPLFIFRDGATLSRPRLVQSLRQALHTVGVDDAQYSGHSFRIGAATAAARAGLSDSLIKTLGRWKSSAFSLYIRTPWQHLRTVSAALIAPHTHVP